MNETEIRLKRVRMRSWRRGMKEMDLILGGYADACLADLTESELTEYEDFIAQADQTLYEWISGKEPAPSHFLGSLSRIRAYIE